MPSPVDPPTTSPEVLTATQDHLFGFLRQVSSLGEGVSAGEQADFLRALTEFPAANPRVLYWQARVCLLRRIEDLEDFDAVFDAWFGSGSFTVTPPSDPDGGDDEEQPEAPNPSSDGQLAPAEVAEGTGAQASSADLTTGRSFAATPWDQRRALTAMRRAWPEAVPSMRSRRFRPARRGPRLDARAVGRAASRTGGEIVHLHWRHRPRRPRRLLLLIDVSGSMKEHSDDLLRAAHAAVRSCPRVEVFTFGTRLTRVTEQLRAQDVDRALDDLAGVVADVDGGTRIGVAFEEFLAHDHHLGLVRDAVVVVMSDGLERGDCTPMERTTQRLARLSHRLVWWSPLACDPAYRPVTRGMSLIVDDLDVLDGVRDLRSAADAVARLAHIGTDRCRPPTGPPGKARTHDRA